MMGILGKNLTNAGVIFYRDVTLQRRISVIGGSVDGLEAGLANVFGI